MELSHSYSETPSRTKNQKTLDKNLSSEILKFKNVLYCPSRCPRGVQTFWKCFRWPEENRKPLKNHVFRWKPMDFLGFPCQNLLWTADTLTAGSARLCAPIAMLPPFPNGSGVVGIGPWPWWSYGWRPTEATSYPFDDRRVASLWRPHVANPLKVTLP